MPRRRTQPTIWHLALLCAALSGCDRPATLAWRWAGNGPSRTGLLPLENGVIAGNEAGAVVRLTRDGKVVWLSQVGREVAARPAVVGDTVVAATVAGEWVGLSLETGEQRWRVGGKPPLTLPLASDGERAFAITEDGSVVAVSGENGGTAWKRLPPRGAAEGMALSARPVVLGERLFVALGNAGLIALNPEDGDTLWQRPGNFLGFIAEGARIYALARDGRMVALSTGEGSVEWERSLEVEAISGPTLSRGLLWIGAEGSKLVAVDPQDGSIAWQTQLPAPLKGGVDAYRELVLVPTAGREGRLLGFRPGQPEPVVNLQLDSPLRSAPRVFGDHMLIQVSDGRVLAYEIKRTSR